MGRCNLQGLWVQNLPNGPGPLWDEAHRVQSILRGQAVSWEAASRTEKPPAATNSQVEAGVGDTAGQAKPPAL